MKVLFFTTAYDPQKEVQVVHQQFLQHLQKAGCRVAILTSRGANSRGPGFIQEQVNGIPIYRYAIRNSLTEELLNRLSRGLFHYDGLLTILQRYRSYLRHFSRPEIIHVESAYPLGTVAAWTRRACDIPFVITVRGADLFNEPEARFGYARYPIVRRLLRRTLAHADAVRATTPQTREIILGYGAPPERVHLVPRNIRDDCFPADRPAFRERARARVCRRYQLDPDQPILLAAGRLLPIKGFDDLLRALPAVLEAVPRAVLLLCGPNRHDPVVGDYRAYLKGLARRLGIERHLLLAGEVPAGEFTPYLAAADLVVVPSIREGSNKVLLEGAALGTPFVATETSGTGVFFRDPPGGIEVPPANVPALSAAIQTLLLDEERRRTLGENAARTADRFRSERVAGEMLTLYRQVLQKKRGAGG